MMDYNYVYLILLLPALSFLMLGLLGIKMSRKVAGLVGTAVLDTVFCLSCYTAYEYFVGVERDVDGLYPTITFFSITWLKFTELPTFNIGLRLTPTFVMMLVVISTVSFMVHIYFFGYIHGERGFQHYYVFLPLFTMPILGLVVATDISQIYLFWELIGVSSYLPIGFYYPMHIAVAASKRASIVTRFVDLLFLVGILFYSFYVGTFNYDLAATPELVTRTAHAAWVMPLALSLMLIGGVDKSAMFPLHIWLPDVTEGPTPVSALIHTVAMVAAGVYLVASIFPLFIICTPEQLHWIAYIAVFTAFCAAAVVCAQSDIKRVLTFSTVSRIGFMLVALGACLPNPATGMVIMIEEYAGIQGLGYMASMSHLFMHTMFEARLFLRAGCVIHVVHSNERYYIGGPRKYIPVAHIAFLILCPVTSGTPSLFGFYSKDEILVACYNFHPVMGAMIGGIAMMTTFYMFRLHYVIFWGKSYYESRQGEPDVHEPHEAPTVITFPLVFLPLITCTAFLWGTHVGQLASVNGIGFNTHTNWTMAITNIVLTLPATGLATSVYRGEKTPVADKLASALSTLYRTAYRRLYVDEIWQFVTHKIILHCASCPIARFDRHVIGGFFNSLARGVWEADENIRPWQSGDVRQYTAWSLTGSIASTLTLIYLL